MLSGELKSKVNQLWDKFWSRGISNPITAIEQISYLIFMKRLDDNDQLEKAKAIFEDNKNFKSLFEGKDDCRWSQFTQLEPEKMLEAVSQKAFPFIKDINDEAEPYSRYMTNAVFVISNPALLDEAVKAINDIYQNIEKQQSEGQQFQDTQGDVYEYLINEIGTSGKNGQFRTPRHLIQLMCEIVNPDWTDKICDPACGTGGFLVGAYQHILTKYTSEDEIIQDENGLKRFKKVGGNKISKQGVWDKLWTKAFYGFDVDDTMVRIGLMNLMLHGIKIPRIEQIDTLSRRYDDHESDEQYSVIMANPPFTGRIDEGGMSESFSVKGTQSELLFINRIVKMLTPGGRAGLIVPEGVLFGGDNAQKQARTLLLRDCQLEAVVSLPNGAFKPYTNVKTAILFFTKVTLDSKEWHTDKVWFYNLESDGYSLDDNRRKLKEQPLPDAISAYKQRSKDLSEDRRGVHFYVPLEEIEKNDYDLSSNRYKEFEYLEQTYEPPKEILSKLLKLEDDVMKEMNELNGLIQ